MNMTLNVKGMHCPSCSMLIEDVLQDMGVKVVEISINEPTETGTIVVNTDLSKEDLVEAIEAEGGYKVL